MISLDDFLSLPVEKVARCVRAAGPQVCVFPINGTRRWFLLEHTQNAGEDLTDSYLEIAGRKHLDLYRLFFEHGIDTLITPTLGADILLRGEMYMQHIGAAGLERLANHPRFIQFYEEWDVRVRFYGNHRRQLADTPYAYLSQLFDQVTEKTKDHRQYRLFFGVFGNDATEAVAEFAIKYNSEHGRMPDRRTIVEMYYGEYVEPVTFFIGFDRFSAFDYPLLGLGEEDLYFMVAPSPYLSERQLRAILYDHIYTRRVEEPAYSSLPANDWQQIRNFYLSNLDTTFGLGDICAGIWFPRIKLTNPEGE